MNRGVQGFGDEQLKEESSWTYPLIILLVTLTLSAVFLYYYVGPRLEDIAGDVPKPTVSDERVTIVIGGRAFSIPANHTVYPRARRGGERDSVALYALWPNLSPYTPTRRLDFIENAPDTRRIDIFLERDSALFDEAERFDRIFLPLTVDPEGEPTAFGLTQFAFKDRRQDTPLNGYRDEDLFVDLDDGAAKLVLRCFKDTPDMPSPYCRRDVTLTEGVALTYLFKRPYLPQWRSIDEAVRAFAMDLLETPEDE